MYRQTFAIVRMTKVIAEACYRAKGRGMIAWQHVVITLAEKLLIKLILSENLLAQVLIQLDIGQTEHQIVNVVDNFIARLSIPALAEVLQNASGGHLQHQ